MLTTLLLLRLIPYGIIAVYAYRKGFKWLMCSATFLAFVALYNFLVVPAPEVRAIFSSILAFLLLLHVIDLRTRR